MFGKKRIERAISNLHIIVIDHKSALIAARIKLYSPDRYGVLDPKKWLKELTYFKTNVIDVRLAGLDKALLEAKWKKNYFDELDAIIIHLANQ